MNGKKACLKKHGIGLNIDTKAYNQPSVIHEKIVSKINEKCYKNGSGIISFKDAGLITSHYLRLKKADMHVFFSEMQRLGLIEIVPYHGVRVLKI